MMNIILKHLKEGNYEVGLDLIILNSIIFIKSYLFS
jgi:hypothetical protein